jgi:metal-sulfur cluster biosynthetic enzyme
MVTQEQLVDALKRVYDPEIPDVDIVELGLIYEINLEGSKVDVKMTLTSAGCPVGPQLVGEARRNLLAIEGVEEADVEVVWDPPWTPDRMSEAAKLMLGIL